MGVSIAILATRPYGVLALGPALALASFAAYGPDWMVGLCGHPSCFSYSDFFIYRGGRMITLQTAGRQPPQGKITWEAQLSCSL